MRERFRAGELQTKSAQMLSKAWNGVQTYWGDAYWKERSDLERMYDEPKTRFVSYGSSVRRKAFKNVLHDQWSCQHWNSQQWVTTVGSGTEYVGGCMLLQNAVFNAPWSPNTPYVLSDWAYNRALSRALAPDYGHYNRWRNIKPTMATRANLAVFLYELREFKRMWDFIPQKHILIKGASQGTLTWGALRQWWDRVRKENKSPSEVAALVNGQHLNYNFGWKPFVSDIRKCWRGLETFEERLNRFTRDAGKELRKRFRDSPRRVNDVVVGAYATGFGNRYRLREYCDIEEQHASAFDFSYLIPQYSNEELRWRALADTLGLKITPSQFWTVLPWSFVVDWFVDVGGFLESYENDWLQPWIKLHQGCYSRRIKGTIRVVAEQCVYGSAQFPGINMVLSQYIRRVGLPNFSAVTDPLDADKIRLGTSLLLSLFLR